MKIYPIEKSDIPEVRVLAGECFVDAFDKAEAIPSSAAGAIFTILPVMNFIIKRRRKK